MIVFIIIEKKFFFLKSHSAFNNCCVMVTPIFPARTSVSVCSPEVWTSSAASSMWMSSRPALVMICSPFTSSTFPDSFSVVESYATAKVVEESFLCPSVVLSSAYLSVLFRFPMLSVVSCSENVFSVVPSTFQIGLY